MPAKHSDEPNKLTDLWDGSARQLWRFARLFLRRRIFGRRLAEDLTFGRAPHLEASRIARRASQADAADAV
jgi:hypothetical protein